MPFSSKEGKNVIRNWAAEHSDLINTVLDIGAGNGTYIHLLKIKRKTLAHATWIAIEAWEPYVSEYELKTKYHKVIIQDVRTINWQDIGPIDLAILGDVLEHMTKEEAKTLINELFKFTKYAVISIPIVYSPQGEEFGNPFEVHVKDDWTHAEVMETFEKYLKKFVVEKTIGVYWLEA